jgi:4-amino-4-deoxy-L-arabinose transferase-like glycosyltransferase
MNVRRILLIILLTASVARIGVMVLLHSWEFPSEREFGYEEGEIAYALANGQGFSWPQTWRPVGPPGAMVQRDRPEPTTWKAPIAPSIIAAAFWLFGSYTAGAAVAIQLFQVVLSVISVYLVFLLGRAVFNERTGLVAAFIFAVYPTSIYFSVKKIEYATLLTFLGLLFIHQTLAMIKRPTMSGSLLLGAIAGVATLVNPVILAFCLPAGLWFLWTCTADWSTRVKSGIVAAACCTAVLTPWLVRNYLVFDQFIFIRSNFSREFVRSNSEKDRRELASEHARTGQNEEHATTRLNERAISLVLEEPAGFLQNVAIRFRNFWTNLSQTSGPTKMAVAAAYYSVLLLAIAGVWIARRSGYAQFLALYLITMPIPFYLTWARLGRFRFPIEPVLVVFAAFALMSLVAGYWGTARDKA